MTSFLIEFYLLRVALASRIHKSYANHALNTVIISNPAETEAITKTVDIVAVYLIINTTEQNVLIFNYGVFRVQMTRLSASISISPSCEIMFQQVRKFVNT